MGSNKTIDLDPGLSVLCTLASPGQTLTLEDIAYVCGSSRQHISRIEQSGLKKLRSRLKLSDHLEN